MNAGKNNIVITQKILKEIGVIKDVVSRLTKEDFLKDDIVQRAVAMTLINIGELASVFSEEFREEHSNIPWLKIRGLRNIIAHRYEIIDFEDVWETARVSIPQLEKYLREIEGN